MSSSIAIPPRRGGGTQSTLLSHSGSSPNSFASSTMSSSMGSMMSPPSGLSTGSPSASSKGKGKAAEYGFGSSPSSSSPLSGGGSRAIFSARRPSLMGTSLSKSEYTVVNLGHEDGPPRLVTCVKSSQGFDWNQELFLPSYADYDSHDLEHRPDPVEEIRLTDEEVEAMMPR